MSDSETERLRLESELDLLIKQQGGRDPRRLLYALFALNLILAVILASVAISNREVLNVLLDCVEPSTPTEVHECNDRSRRQTAAAVSQIVDANDNGKLDNQEILDGLVRLEELIRQSPSP